MSKKKKITLEYPIKSSPSILYSFLTSPSNLAQWFADEVDIQKDVCTFVWNGYPEKAYIVDQLEDEMVRYRWESSDEDEYFEFRITRAEVTNDTILIITDFVEEDEEEDQRLWWDNQIKNLTMRIGG